MWFSSQKFLSIENTLRVTESMEIVLKWGVNRWSWQIHFRLFANTTSFLYLRSRAVHWQWGGKKEGKKKRDETRRERQIFSVFSIYFCTSLGGITGKKKSGAMMPIYPGSWTLLSLLRSHGNLVAASQKLEENLGFDKLTNRGFFQPQIGLEKMIKNAR